jgi:hypothetical protein
MKIMLVSLVFLLLGCNQRTSPAVTAPALVIAPTDKHTLYFDDIFNDDDGEGRVFESAFVLDRACHGLKIIRWNHDDHTLPIVALFDPHWEVVYGEGVGVNRGRTMLFMEAVDFNGSEVEFQVKNIEEAAHKACIVANGEGGTR